MSQSDPLIRLQHMLDHAQEAMAMLGSRSLEELRDNRQLQLALIQLIQIIGEAAAKIPQDFRRQHPTVSWREATSMRNRLIHGYDVVEYTIIHDTVRNDLPLLVSQLQSIFREIGKD